ncbi:unnamed protein product [Macrosiphum euphorbiae]|uniref:Uncharacterized protein n=1 Tax=Macrosiphum euphorbiae TaxID=13131 RepID=A0AAV0WPA5_9HEMI|nr:unnamed protein product [Macrosiphum euphorbiae]
MMFKYMCLVLFITWYQLAECHPASSNVKAMDSMIEKESEAFLSVEAEDSSHKNVRDKRTIGFLRQLFPNLSQIVDRKIQQITRFVFRVIGRLVLRGGGNGAGGTAPTGGAGGESGGNGGRRISITLPTFPPSTDDEDEDTATVLPTADTSSSPASPSSDSDPAASRIVEPVSSEAAATDSAPAASADSATAADSAVAADSASEVAVTTAEPAATSAPVTTASTEAAPVTNAAPAAGSVSTTTVAAAAAAAATATANAISSPTTQMPLDSDNTVGTGIVKRTAREVSTNEPSSTKKRSPLSDTDNDVSSDNSLSSNTGDDAQAETVADEDPRNKRFLFNLRGGAGGGSGNFLFDLIRLVAGSGANQDRDESADSVPAEAGEAQEIQAGVNAKEDGYSVGVPGPLTRIFVIANRGVANLVQDLILRLAQTTERIVNFKARLITSLI